MNPHVLKSKGLCVFRSPVAGQLIVNSLLTISLAQPDDFGTYSCTNRNRSAQFCLHASSKTALVRKGVTLQLEL